MKRLIWQLGLPMVVSMILQAVYNIVDTAFVINMGEEGVAGNLALTYAFPIQLLTIAVGVGTGIGINHCFRAISEKKGRTGRKKEYGAADEARSTYYRFLSGQKWGG